MDTDDRPIGHVFSRREVLGLLGVAGYSTLLGCSPAGGQGAAADSTACIVRPEQTEGPYFVDERLHRSDLRSDPADGTVRPGVPLELILVVGRLSGAACTPLAGVRVDIWHCDHLGVYSDVEDPGFNTRGKRFLRGYQSTDAQGRARFATIYPGWYEGRTVHIHFKLRSPSGKGPGFAFTSQLYFADALTDLVFTRPPYSTRGKRSSRNADDGIFRRGGRRLLLAPIVSGEGYAATFKIALTSVQAARRATALHA